MLDVGIFPHFRTAFLLLRHQMKHPIGRTIEKIMMNPIIRCLIGIAPTLDMSRGIDVMPLLPPAISRIAQDIPAHFDIFHVAFGIAVVHLQKIFDGIHTAFHQIVPVDDVFQHLLISSGGNLMGNARIIGLINPAAGYLIIIAAAVNLHTVAEAGHRPPSPLRIIGIGPQIMLNGAANPTDLAVGDLQSTDTLSPRRNSVQTNVFQTKVVDPHIGIGAHHEHGPAGKRLNGSKHFPGISLITAEIKVTQAFFSHFGNREILSLGGGGGENIGEMPIDIQVSLHFLGHHKGSALIVPANKPTLNVGGNQLNRMGLAFVEHQGSRIKNFFVHAPDMVKGIDLFPKGRISQILIPAVQTGLFPRSVRTIGNAGTGIHPAAEDISPTEEYAVSLLERCCRYLGKSFPCPVGGKAVILVIAFLTDIINLTRYVQIIGRLQDFLPALLAQRFHLL